MINIVEENRSNQRYLTNNNVRGKGNGGGEGAGAWGGGRGRGRRGGGGGGVCVGGETHQGKTGRN